MSSRCQAQLISHPQMTVFRGRKQEGILVDSSDLSQRVPTDFLLHLVGQAWSDGHPQHTGGRETVSQGQRLC